MNMKSICPKLKFSFFLFPLLTTLCLSWGASVKAEVHKAYVENVFIPKEGFDDNDNVQMVIVGKLPNICFELGNTEVKRMAADKNEFSVVQYLRRRSVLGCENVPSPADDENQGGNFLSWPVQYQKEISLGNLNSGDFVIHYEKGVAQMAERHFRVDKGTVDNVDEILYAPISSSFIPEMVFETDNGEAVLTGVLSSTCMKLEAQKIKILRQDDVIVVLPEMSIDRQTPCAFSPRPINQIVPLGPLKEGKYLLHVRSMSGLSINRVFNVTKAPFFERRM